MADGIALEGIKNVKDSLLTAIKIQMIYLQDQNVSNIINGINCISKRTRSNHSLSHPINAVNDIHHGLSNAIFMHCT